MKTKIHPNNIIGLTWLVSALMLPRLNLAQTSPSQRDLKDGKVLDGRASATFSSDGKRLVALSANPAGLKVWDCETGQEMLHIGVRDPREQPLSRPNIPLSFTQVLFSQDNTRLITTGILSTQGLASWDAHSGELLGRWGTDFLAPDPTQRRPDPAASSQRGPLRLTSSPDGKLVYGAVCSSGFGSLGFPGAVGCWDAKSGQLLFSLLEFPIRETSGIEASGTLRSLILSPDGKHLAAYLQTTGMRTTNVGPLSQASALAVWDAVSGKHTLLLNFRTETLAGPRIAFSAEGKRLAVFAGGRSSRPGGSNAFGMPAALRWWEVESGKELPSISMDKFKADYCQQILFSPDDTSIALVLNARQAVLLEGATGKLLRTFDSATVIHQVAFSPDSKLLAAGCGNPNEILGSSGEIKVWKVDDSTIVHLFKGQRGLVSEVKFSPDGKRILSLNEVSMVLWTLPAN